MNNELTNYQPVIGLEVHVELKTNSKMFCGCSADYFGKEPNTHTCPVCLGLPGALPVPNKIAIEWCVLIGMALNCHIPLFSKFDRKNYFYPDLTKGYQISQYDEPFAINGSLKLKVKNEKLKIEEEKIIRIRRVHMEEDTGKLSHSEVEGEKVSLIDFNRSGVPLVEIVTEPDFENSREVVEYLKKLRQIVRYVQVSNADMEKGDMRLEPNISLRKNGQTELPSYKVEVKNINSFRFVEKAIEYEIKRQAELLDIGEIPLQETRGWHETKQKTVSQRVKEEANDYRYFPEPDIPPIRWNKQKLEELRKTMPEMPQTKFERFQKEYHLATYDSEILTREQEIADYFEKAVLIASEEKITPKQIANIIINKKIEPKNTSIDELIKQIMASSAKLTGNLTQKDLDEIEQVIAQNSKVVNDYKKGKENAIMFLVGLVMRKSKRKVNPQLVRRKIEELLKN